VLAKSEVMRLGLAEKRQIVGALLQSALRAPRSFPLSYAQEQLWFMDKLQPGSPVYNIPLYVPFQGTLDVEALENALATLTQRHDMLRVRFATADDQPVQIVEPEMAVELPVEDLSHLPADQRNAALGQLLNEEVQQPFDLAGRTCVRYRLFKLDSSNHLLSVTQHHIITDAWSLGVFVAELNTAYQAFRSGERSAPLAPLQVEYSDYAQWQRAHLRGLRLSKLLSYWTTQLAGAPHVLQLPTDRPRPKDQTFNGTVAGFVFDDDLSAALIALARQHRLTLFMLLLACYYALLYRYTGQEDILVGAPVANRAHPELEPVVGLFVNTLILRVRLADTQTFADLLRSVQEVSLAAFEHQALPFPKLVDELNVERVPGHPPLYQVVFNFQNAALIESANPSAEGETMNNGNFPFVHSNTSKVDLNLTVTQNGDGISGGFEYNTDLFDAETVADMIAHYKRIAEQVVRDPSISLIDIPLGADAPAPDAGARGLEQRPAGGVAELIERGEFSF
jgi:Condensation domain